MWYAHWKDDVIFNLFVIDRPYPGLDEGLDQTVSVRLLSLKPRKGNRRWVHDGVKVNQCAEEFEKSFCGEAQRDSLAVEQMKMIGCAGSRLALLKHSGHVLFCLCET